MCRSRCTRGTCRPPRCGSCRFWQTCSRRLCGIAAPHSVAILGIAGGNGLERLDTEVTRRIVGVDIHPEYLEAVRRRFPNLPLTLFPADLRSGRVPAEPVDLVHAALIFEHAGSEECLRSAASLVAAGGHLSVVLQLPADSAAQPPQIGSGPMKAVKEWFRHVDPVEFKQRLALLGFSPVEERRRALPAGKAFWSGVFTRSSGATARPSAS
ncbi:MAG: class I SAM-dependent methyltransferase [Bryobacteraceae bacterium]|nr:class I SAM-dependent methyltransferase [Bryobacteraceae bacterium]